MKMTITQKLSAAYSRCVDAVSYLQSPLLLAIRMYWGWQFYQTGLGKLQNIPKVVDFFTSLGIPFPTLNAYIVGISECVGGILLFIGLGSRIVSLFLVTDMTVAFLTGDRDALKMIFADPAKFYQSDTFTFWLASALILIFGPGKIALDTLMARWLGRDDGSRTSARIGMSTSSR
jgi:putative oxidoreductase